MATKRYYATGAFRYGTRMLTAGDPVDLTAPNARLFTALGKITDKKPRERIVPAVEEVLAAEVVEEKPAEPKAAPRKRATRRKAKK